MTDDRWRALSEEMRTKGDELLRAQRRVEAIRVVREAMTCSVPEAQAVVAERAAELLAPRPVPTVEELRQRVAVARKPYHDEVGRILRLAPLPRRRGWRVVFRPSFHAECAVEVFDDLRVVSPRAQIWAWMNRFGDPAVAWVEPAVADERVSLRADEVDILAGALDSVSFKVNPGASVVIDGMPATFARCSSEAVDEVEWNLGSSGEEGDQLVRFGRVLLDFALERVRWEASRAALSDIARYFPGFEPT